MPNKIPRSRAAREMAEEALARVVSRYGSTPEFVLMGGLIPDLLCSGSDLLHVGTTDVDVQVNLEIASGSVNAARLEHALLEAGLVPDAGRAWRWRWANPDPRAVVRFDLLADLDTVEAHAIIRFDDAEHLGAMNLRGTAFASRDVRRHSLPPVRGAEEVGLEVNVTGLAGFLLAKTAAAAVRRAPKDWYDIAFVLRHNDEGGPREAARAVDSRFPREVVGPVRTGLRELAANFENLETQGSRAYAEQMLLNHPEFDRAQLLADAVVAVTTYAGALLGDGGW